MAPKPEPVTYYQQILDKISHADAPTFRKELRKAFRRLSRPEREELKRWFRQACLCRPAPPLELRAAADQRGPRRVS